jgi:hypothetical protein
MSILDEEWSVRETEFGAFVMFDRGYADFRGHDARARLAALAPKMAKALLMVEHSLAADGTYEESIEVSKLCDAIREIVGSG